MDLPINSPQRRGVRGELIVGREYKMLEKALLSTSIILNVSAVEYYLKVTSTVTASVPVSGKGTMSPEMG